MRTRECNAGHQGDLLWLTSLEEAVVERTQDRVEPDGCYGRHVECGADWGRVRQKWSDARIVQLSPACHHPATLHPGPARSIR
jgi:hypothetical protein